MNIKPVHIGHIQAHFRRGHRPHESFVMFYRIPGIEGARQGSPLLGDASDPPMIRRFALRLLLWAEEIEERTKAHERVSVKRRGRSQEGKR